MKYGLFYLIYLYSVLLPHGVSYTTQDDSTFHQFETREESASEDFIILDVPDDCTDIPSSPNPIFDILTLSCDPVFTAVPILSLELMPINNGGAYAIFAEDFVADPGPCASSIIGFSFSPDPSDNGKLLTNISPQDLELRILENISNDPDQYGSFILAGQGQDYAEFRYRHPNYLSGSSLNNQFTLLVSDSQNGTALGLFELLVWRAPVVMVHGLWSGRSAFEDMENALVNFGYYSPFQIRRVDYEPTNSRSFGGNYMCRKSRPASMQRSFNF